MKQVALMMTMGVFSAALFLATPVHALTVTQLELTGGAVNYQGEHRMMVDRLLEQSGTVKMGQYQAIGEIMPSINKACETFSLFTSGFNGMAAPSVTISGSSIKVDLSSLFLGISQGNSVQTWNIGQLATGLYNPDTREFSLSWNRLFDGGQDQHMAKFFLTGLVNFGTQPVAIPAAMVLYATGIVGMGLWTCWRRSIDAPTTA